MRKLVRSVIAGAVTAPVYYERADENAMFPHVVFAVDRVDELDIHRHDYTIVIDVWCKDEAATQAENMADAIEDAFNANNLPQDTILPTFFLESRMTVMDEDKKSATSKSGLRRRTMR